MTDEIKRQILTIRETGLTNMFDTRTVKEIGAKFGFKEMIQYINDNPDKYCNFIMWGDENKKA